MKHAILGVGAIGGLLGTALASVGEDVVLIVRPEQLAIYPRTLVWERPAGVESVTAPAKAVAVLTEPVDVLWIATKTYQMEAALELVKATPQHVIPLLNGVDHMAALRKQFGNERVIPATIAVEAEKSAPGKFVQRSPFLRLNLGSSAEPLLGATTEALRKLGFTCQFIDKEQTLLWSKLCFLGPFALATSASGMNIGEVLADPAWNKKLRASVSEAYTVANADGATINEAKVQALFEGTPPAMRSSMQKDLVAGRPIELDAIGGAIVRAGERHGIEVSATSNLMEAIRAKLAVSA
jgi:2-dehydropantoate 2-reductase